MIITEKVAFGGDTPKRRRMSSSGLSAEQDSAPATSEPSSPRPRGWTRLNPIRGKRRNKYDDSPDGRPSTAQNGGPTLEVSIHPNVQGVRDMTGKL